MLIVLVISMSTTVTEATVDIDWLAVTTYMEYADGTPTSTLWDFYVWVQATNPGDLFYIEITMPGDAAPFGMMYEGDNQKFLGFFDT